MYIRKLSYPVSKSTDFIEQAGFWTLYLTLFLISFPRTWSLYSLAAFLTIGVTIWIIKFKEYFYQLRKVWYFVLPPVFYFFVNLVSAIFQEDSVKILQTRLMFLLIPILGFPVFFSGFTKSRINILFQGFTSGVLLISIFLIIRVIIKLYTEYPGDLNLQNTYPGDFPFIPWFNDRQLDYLSNGFSVLEHPTYLALKVNWVLCLLMFYDSETWFTWKAKVLFSIILSLTVFLLASKSGLFIWFILALFQLIKRFKLNQNRIMYLLIIPALILVAFLSVKEIKRIEKFFNNFKTEISTDRSRWKDIDARTREWYSAIQLIKQKPVFGAGISKVDDEMVAIYEKNGFKEEAALRLNAHNQFLEAQMTFGIIGTFSLLLMLFLTMFFRKRFYYYKLLGTFLFINIFFLFFESMFNRQWGIMFFLLFYHILSFPGNVLVPQNNDDLH